MCGVYRVCVNGLCVFGLCRVCVVAFAYCRHVNGAMNAILYAEQ